MFYCSGGVNPSGQIVASKSWIGETGQMGLELNIENYYKWAASGLVGNRNRGIFAEWLVGQALNAIKDGDQRIEWDAVDLRSKDVAIEVKASGRNQGWDATGSSTPRWSIPKNKRVWEAKNNEVISFDSPERNADIYIFCLHESIPATNENVADPASWSFWVIATKIIDKELGDQRSLGESTLNQLTQSVSWLELPKEFKRVIESI